MGAVIPGVAKDGIGARAEALRCGDAATLALALQRGREQLLALFDGFERALGPGGLHIAQDPVLNLPLWELGHIGWFEEFWQARNPERLRGAVANPAAPRAPSLRADADALYDSSAVAHARRWQLALPDPDVTRDYLAAVRRDTLELLEGSDDSDASLYFLRLVLFHEDMHREAWHIMAQHLGIDLGPAMVARAPRASTVEGEWALPGTVLQLGAEGPGFIFDNEAGAHEVPVEAFAIDRAPVSWARFLPFVEDGGYEDRRWWSDEGWQWRMRQAAAHPRHLRRDGAAWSQQRFGSWGPLAANAPACHLSAHEARAWCRWAGRRLPTEAEWERAATCAAADGEAFDWGEVWEWTASPFAPYPGFAPHPYRDYSQPWFDGRPVLRGGSFATASHMKHRRYRNFFPADRVDVFAGFRTCTGPA